MMDECSRASVHWSHWVRSAGDESMSIVRCHVPCIGCGYDLFTAAAESVCPECSKPVVESLRPKRLEFQRPEWLIRVRRGVTQLLCAIIILYFGLIVTEVVFRLFGTGSDAGSSRVVTVGLTITLFAVWVLCAFGVTLVTTKTLRTLPASNAARWAARSCLLLGPFALTLSIACTLGLA